MTDDRSISLSSPAGGLPANGNQFRTTIGGAVVSMLDFASTLISELLTAVETMPFVGVQGAATMFATKIAFFFHGKYEMQKLERIVRELQQAAREASEKGMLINFKDERNLQGLFDKIEDYMTAREEAKTDMLRRVAINGLIPQNVDQFMERNFRYAIKTLEIEDIAVLKKMMELGKEVRPIISSDGSVPTLVNPEIINRDELPKEAVFSFARLTATGLIENARTFGQGDVQVTPFGKEFLEYIKSS